MIPSVFPRNSVKAYWITVLVVALLLGIATLIADPKIDCACVEPVPGTPDYLAMQRKLEGARAERPKKAASAFLLAGAGGGVLFVLMTAAGIALRPILGPYE